MCRVRITLFCQSNSLIPSKRSWSWQCSPWARLSPFFREPDEAALNETPLCLLLERSSFPPSWQVFSLTRLCSVLFHFGLLVALPFWSPLTVSQRFPRLACRYVMLSLVKGDVGTLFDPLLAFAEQTKKQLPLCWCGYTLMCVSLLSFSSFLINSVPLTCSLQTLHLWRFQSWWNETYRTSVECLNEQTYGYFKAKVFVLQGSWHLCLMK